MKRFVSFAVTTLLSVSALASLCGCQGVSDKEIGLQLYSIREVIGSPEKYDANHAEAFAALHDMGYRTIEMYGYSGGKFFGHTVDEIKADLEAAGLKAISTHTTRNLSAEELESGDFSPSLAWWQKTIADHKALGCSYIVAPSFKIPDNLEDLKTWCNYFNEVGRLCKAEGVQFGYHNHRGEFRKIGDTVIYDYMLQNTDPELVFFEMDLYWAVQGGASPVEYFGKYPGRFKMFHVKDHYEVGVSGMVAFDVIFNAADKAGLEHYFVEIEQSNVEGGILESCRLSADYVKSAEFISF